MNTKSATIALGINETGLFIGEGDYRIYFTHEQRKALSFALLHSDHLAKAFTNYCSMTFALGSIPTCFRQDLSADEIEESKEDLRQFKEHFAAAFFNLMLAIDF